jgi:chromate reductase, NAD(P)H dehydrogenase (quinone)
MSGEPCTPKLTRFVATIRLLAISGSLRAASVNTAVLRAAARLAPSRMEIFLYTGLGNLPAFNPDLDNDPVPDVVQMLRHEIGLADGLLISSPEYARGVPGSLKNALDWLVSSSEFPGKPIALIQTSPRAVNAPAQLRLVLSTMSARLIDVASLTLPLLGRSLDAKEIVADASLAAPLRGALDAFVEAIRK